MPEMTPLEIYEATQRDFRREFGWRHWREPLLRGELLPWYGPDGKDEKFNPTAFKTGWGPERRARVDLGGYTAIIPVYR